MAHHSTHHFGFPDFHLVWWFTYLQSFKIRTQRLSHISPADLCWLISSEVSDSPESWLTAQNLNMPHLLRIACNSSSWKRCWVRFCPKYLSDANTHPCTKQQSRLCFSVLTCLLTHVCVCMCVEIKMKIIFHQVCLQEGVDRNPRRWRQLWWYSLV